MRYGVPRSLSPQRRRRRRVKRQPRQPSTFGVYFDSDNDDDDSDEGFCDSDGSSSGSSSASSSSTDSFLYESDSEIPKPTSPSKLLTRSTAEGRQLEDTVASIRRRVRHHDAYDEWERRMRRDAFRTARDEFAALQTRWQDQRGRKRTLETTTLASAHSREVAEVAAQLASMDLRRKTEEARLLAAWKERDRKLWERIEGVIKVEEDNVKARLEAERQAREEAEMKRREVELKKELARREEEEKRREEEERLRKEEEDRKLEEEIELAMRQADEFEEEQRREQMEAEVQGRNRLGLTTAEEDWKYARQMLLDLKAGPMKTVKADKHMKSVWSAGRRQITPKIGQLTNDRQSIMRISQQIYEVLVPPSGAHPLDVYHALLSSLAKAILLQAETEVTAEKRSAGPLAEVTAKLLMLLPTFSDILFAKLVQRAGGWAVPCVVPRTDVDGRPWRDEDERLKVMGYRRSGGEEGAGLESTGEYVARVSGMMRVYFGVLKVPMEGSVPMGGMFRVPRYWIWFSRMLGEKGLLETAVAPQIMYVGLEEFGLEARHLWGQQWVKMLRLLHEGLTEGLGEGSSIGGQSAEGKAAKVRVELEIERIMGR